jgi:hypothetical protein
MLAVERQGTEGVSGEQQGVPYLMTRALTPAYLKEFQIVQVKVCLLPFLTFASNFARYC